MRNPFTLGIAQKNDFCNRKKEITELLQHARNGDNTVLFSPRRYGKSSLIAKIIEQLGEEGYLTVYVDLYPITSEQDFISRFSSGIFKGIGRGADTRTIADRLKNMFSRLVPSLEVRPDGYNISARFDRNSQPGLLLDDLLEGLYKYVKKEKLRACIALDEFQEITELPDSKKIEGILRSQIQFHKEISYFYVGSRRRILTDMFSNKNRAFYKSAFSYTLKEIAKNEFVPYIEAKFRKTGKVCPSEAAAKIYDTVRGYPYYVQKLSSIAWDITIKKCTDETVFEAYSILLAMEKTDFEGIWGGLALIQKSVLKALAKEPTTSPYSREFLERHQLSIGGTQKAMDVLFSRDLIEKDDEGKYRLTDPVMEAWLRG
jgi:AAA+ ATPase superfamily predicted ATPase